MSLVCGQITISWPQTVGGGDEKVDVEVKQRSESRKDGERGGRRGEGRGGGEEIERCVCGGDEGEEGEKGKEIPQFF